MIAMARRESCDCELSPGLNLTILKARDVLLTARGLATRA
jgi:hypothetical protein